MKNLGERIKIARKQKGYNQKELADLLGKSKNVVSNWERGDNQPDADTLIKLSEHLEKSVTYLLLGYDKALLTRLLSLVIFKSKYRKTAKEMGVSVDELTNICKGNYSDKPRKDLIDAIIAYNKKNLIIENWEILDAAGYVEEADALRETRKNEESMGIGEIARLGLIQKNKHLKVGQNLKLYMQKKNITLEELKEKTGIEYLEKIENDTKQYFLMSDIIKIAEVLGIEPWDLANYSTIVWDTPINHYMPPTREHLSEIEEAYNKASLKSKNIVRVVLDLEPLESLDDHQAQTLTTLNDKSLLSEREEEDNERFKSILEDESYIPDTLAAHNDKDELSEDDKNDIERFKKIVQEKKKKK